MWNYQKQKAPFPTLNRCSVTHVFWIARMNVADLVIALNTRMILDSDSGFATIAPSATINDCLKAKTYILMKIKKKNGQWLQQCQNEQKIDTFTLILIDIIIQTLSKHKNNTSVA
jgi:hypothetical protein